MKAIEIKINGEPLKSLTPLEEVTSVEIRTLGIPVRMERSNARALVSYIYDCTQKCTGVISYNGVIMEKEAVKEIKL